MISLVSIIIPTYNSENLIKDCLKNLGAISKGLFEVIIVDGGSSDLTLELIAKNQVHFNLKTIINPDDKGVYDAMNKGVALSQGHWLYFMGADDRIVDEGFFKALELLESAECDIFYGNVNAEHIDGDYKIGFDFRRLLNQNICHQGIFYRRSIFHNIGLYNLRYKYWADYEFNLRCFVKSSVQWLYAPITIAYHAPGGLSSTIKRDVFFDEDLILNINSAIEQPFNKKVRFLFYLYAFCFENYGFFISARRVSHCWNKHPFANGVSFSFAMLMHAFNRIKRK